MDAATFFLNTPLYTVVKLETYPQIDSIMLSNTKFDGYNPIDDCETTFIIKAGHYRSTSKDSSDNITTVEISCMRTGSTFRFFVSSNIKDISLKKIGQDLSVADFHKSEIKKYRKVLNSEKSREFTKAIGLAANGVGIGSFVYLRRIFEYLIDEAYQLYKKDEDFNEQVYNKQRIAERIQTLAPYLPEFLVEHKEIYSILRKGIHELDEQDCLAHFDALRIGIEMILDEKLEKYEKEKKKMEARAKIKAATEQLSKKK